VDVREIGVEAAATFAEITTVGFGMPAQLRPWIASTVGRAGWRHYVAMVSENLARELWGQPAAALGKRIRENTSGQWREVIGVVGDERDNGVDAAAPTTAYWPMLMAKFEGEDVFSRRTMSYMLRSRRTGNRRDAVARRCCRS